MMETDEAVLDGYTKELLEFANGQCHEIIAQLDLHGASMEELASVFSKKMRIANDIPASSTYSSIPLPDIALLPKEGVNAETVHSAKYVLTCVRALGKQDEDIYRYLVRQLILLCKTGGAHRCDGFVLVEKLALFVLERKFFTKEPSHWFGNAESPESEYVTWAETLADAVTYALIMAQETKVETPLALTDEKISELEKMLLDLWSLSKAECAALYADLYWFASRFVPIPDNPILHPLNFGTEETEHNSLEEESEEEESEEEESEEEESEEEESEEEESEEEESEEEESEEE
ncbi:MAG: hypothetical protein ABW189_04160, partial [Rickettsiales bacterium]